MNNIGNLTLIQHNQELGNNSFSAKKLIYADHASMQIAKNKILDQETWGKEQIIKRAEYLVNILLEKVIPVDPEFKTNNNYSLVRKTSKKLSFKELNLIGEEIVYFDDENIKAKVISDKELEFENKIWKLTPLTREIETRKNRRNASGAYWGVDKWTWRGKKLQELMEEIAQEYSEIDEEFTE